MSAVHKKRRDYLKSKGKLIAPEKKELEQLEAYLSKKPVDAPEPKVESKPEPEEKAGQGPKKEKK